MNLEVHSIADDWNWSVVSIVSFWNVISLSVGSINSIAENMFLWAFKTFKFVLPLEGLNWRVTDVVIRLFTITAAVAISIVLCVIVWFALGGNSGSFNVIISISGLFLYFCLYPLSWCFPRMEGCCWMCRRWWFSF